MSTFSQRTKLIVLGPLLIAGVNVAIAVAMSWASDAAHFISEQSLVGISVAFALSGIQFLLWRRVHRDMPLSVSYPITAAMYPGFAALAWLETGQISILQIAGIATIIVAVWWCSRTMSTEPSK